MATISKEWDNFKETSFQPLPNGEYPAFAVESSLTSPKGNPKARMIVFKMEVIEGEYNGRHHTCRFLVDYPGPDDTVQNIHRGQWNAFKIATGRMNAMDTSEYHRIPVVMCLVCKKRKDRDEMQNELARPYFKAKNKGATPTAQAAAAAPVAPWVRDTSPPAAAAVVGGGDSAASKLGKDDVPF